MFNIGTFIHQDLCRRQAFHRIGACGLEVSQDDINHLEHTLEQMRPVYQRPGMIRYRVRVKWKKKLIVVVYDTRLKCLVTAWPKLRVKPENVVM